MINNIQNKLIERMVAANMSLHYSGPEWSFLAINGKSNYDHLFTAGIDIYNEPLDGSIKHSVLFLFYIYSFIFMNIFYFS